MRLSRKLLALPNLDSHLRGVGNRKEKPPGHPPGMLVHVGERRADRVSIRAMAYNADSAEEVEIEDPEQCLRFAGTRGITWIQVAGLHDPEPIRKLGEAFGIHPLIQEDILNTRSRPKIEEFDDYIFVVAKLLRHDQEADTVEAQQFSLLFLPDGSVLTFLEVSSPVFEPVLQRIRSGAGRIRRWGADYLAWALLDTVIDHYYSVADAIDESLLDHEDLFHDNPRALEPSDLYQLKKEASALHRLVRPIRDITTVLHRSESSLLTPALRPYLRDLHDHALHLLEQTEDLRENAASLRDFYLSEASNRMNGIMKVLTCFSTIFLPLTFLVGVYGMNFAHMPELGLVWAYPALWGIFALISAAMFLFFRKKDWL